MIIFVLCLAATVVLASGKNEATEAATGEAPLRVALLFSGFLGDQSFNDSAYAGIQRAADDFGIEVKVFESKEPGVWESNVVSAAQSGYDLVLCVSTNFQEFIKRHAPEFPDIKFALIDGIVEGHPNVSSAVFANNEGCFLTGLVAGLWTTKTSLPGVNDDHVIGFVSGMDIPVVHDFLIGYKQGAELVLPDVEVLVSWAGSWTDPVKGKELTLAQYSQGADVVMNVASGTGPGILEAAAEAGKYAIGVDLNQDATYPGHIITSLLKRVDTACYLTVKSVVDGTFSGGTVVDMNLSNGGVSVTDFSVMKDALGADFPEDILATVDEYITKVKNGEIVVEGMEGF
jgi:basic membrane protein A